MSGDNNQKTILFRSIDPFVRVARFTNIDSNNASFFNKSIIDVVSLDYRLFYISAGKGTFTISGKTYPAERGCLFYWPPGTVYRISADENSTMDILQINFDYTRNNENLSFPIRQVRSDIFSKENIVELVSFKDFSELNHPVILRKMQIIEDTFIELKTEFIVKKKYYRQKVRALAISILSDMARSVKSIDIAPRKSDPGIGHIFKYLHENYQKDLTNSSIASLFNYHPNYINYLMKKNTGKPLHKYLLEHRISKAIDLIQNTDMAITDISDSVGFNNPSHFSKQFRKMTKRSPISFRKDTAGNHASAT